MCKAWNSMGTPNRLCLDVSKLYFIIAMVMVTEKMKNPSLPENLKISIFEIPINAWRTTSAKSINLVIIRKLV